MVPQVFGIYYIYIILYDFVTDSRPETTVCGTSALVVYITSHWASILLEFLIKQGGDNDFDI